MDWNALVIGLLGGLAGGLLGVGASVLVILLQSESEIDREIRAARREHRNKEAQPLFDLLRQMEAYHGALFTRGSLDSVAPRVRDVARNVGVTDEQFDSLNEGFKDEVAPIPNWIEIQSKFVGPVFALEDRDLSNHFMLLVGDLSSRNAGGGLRPDQITALLVKTKLCLEKYVSVVPVRHRRLVERLRRALGFGISEWEFLPSYEEDLLSRLKDEIQNLPPPVMTGNNESSH